MSYEAITLVHVQVPKLSFIALAHNAPFSALKNKA